MLRLFSNKYSIKYKYSGLQYLPLQKRHPERTEPDTLGEHRFHE